MFIIFKTCKRVISVVFSVLLAATPLLGGCSSSKPMQDSDRGSSIAQTSGTHSGSLQAALSNIEKVGDNFRATFNLRALNGFFADNISAKDTSFGMNLSDAHATSIKVQADKSRAILTAEFPSNGKDAAALKGYGDIVLPSNMLKNPKGNADASAFSAIVPLFQKNINRGEDASFKMFISKKDFDTYLRYFNVIGKSLGLDDEASKVGPVEKYVSQYLGIGESISKGNYLEAGLSFLSSIGLVDIGSSEAINVKLDKIINMLGVIEAKTDKQTELFQEASVKIDGTQVAAFKKELGELKNYVGYVNAYLGNAADHLKSEGIVSNASEITKNKIAINNAGNIFQLVADWEAANSRVIDQKELQKICNQVNSSNEEYQAYLDQQKQKEEQSKERGEKVDSKVANSPGKDNHYESSAEKKRASGSVNQDSKDISVDNAKPAEGAEVNATASSSQKTTSISINAEKKSESKSTITNNASRDNKTSTLDNSAASKHKIYSMKDYATMLISRAKEIGGTGTISYDAATNGLIEHLSTVVSMIQLNNEQNPLSSYYNYMSELYNFDTQAYIQTSIFTKDIEEVMDNVVALLYTTTDPSNTQLLNTFKEEYTQGIQVLRLHAPAEPDWTAPYSYVLGSKVHLQAGIQRETDESWVPDMSGAPSDDFVARIRESSLADELMSACFDQYYVDRHCKLDNFDVVYNDDVDGHEVKYVQTPHKLPENPTVNQLFTYSDTMMVSLLEYEQFFSGLTEGAHPLKSDFIQQASTNEFCRGLAFDNYNGKNDFEDTWINAENSPIKKIVDATGIKWDLTGFRSPLWSQVVRAKLNPNSGDQYRAHFMYYYWTFWFQKV